MRSNEIMGIYGTTRKRLVTPIGYDILLVVKRSLEERREGHDRYDRKSLADFRRGSRTAPSQKIYSTQVHQLEATRGRQGWRTLSGKARGSRGLHSQEHYKQIKIATGWWQRTIKHSAAVRSPLIVLRTGRDDPRYSLATFSIAACPRTSQWLCKRVACVESAFRPMKGKFNPFNFKAIETKYDGYKFRSRLEARWATFFNTLGIPYEYEKEGYNLEGTWYLPDFWLPEQECWIEIKGEKPTEEEMGKARDLALYTDNPVHIIYGNIGLPDHKNAHKILMEHPPHIWFCRRIDSKHTSISAPLEARIAIQRASELGMEFGTGESSEGHYLAIKRSFNLAMSLDWFESRIESDIQYLYKLRELIPFIRKCEKELVEIFSQANEDQDVYVTGQDEGPGVMEWVACDHCSEIHIAQIWFSHNETCYRCKQGTLANNSPRLIAAYEAARQSRF